MDDSTKRIERLGPDQRDDLRPRGVAARFLSESLKSFRQSFARGGAAIDLKAIVEDALFARRNRPIAQRRDVRIDQALLVCPPTGRVARIIGMIKDGDAERFLTERPLHVAPRRPLLLAIAAAQPFGIEMRLARV